MFITVLDVIKLFMHNISKHEIYPAMPATTTLITEIHTLSESLKARNTYLSMIIVYMSGKMSCLVESSMKKVI